MRELYSLWEDFREDYRHNPSFGSIILEDLYTSSGRIIILPIGRYLHVLTFLSVWWHTSIATRGALHHQDFQRDPIHFQVMEGEPGMPYNHHLLSKVCNCKMCPFRGMSEAEGDMDFFCD